MPLYIRIILSLYLLVSFNALAQETLPVYSDYLTDNVYLLHPAAAGIGNCSKIRLTGRKQWMGMNNAPELQTLSIHTGISENNGLGLIAFNDTNGYHSQIGGQLTYAYHINMNKNYPKQLSFGLSGLAIRNTLDESEFTGDDPIINQQINSVFYFNADFGMAYHYKTFSSYFTVKNLTPTNRGLYSDSAITNLRRYLIGAGYFFGDNFTLKHEPSFLIQYIEHTQETFADINYKTYYPLENGQIWAGLSFRKGLNMGEGTESPNYFVPSFGINFNRFIISYSYTYQQNNALIDKGGAHQITLGYNFSCKEKFKRENACPNLGAGF